MMSKAVSEVLFACGMRAEDVTAAALYGSQVAGGASPNSDVDLFVLGESPRTRLRVGAWDVLLIPVAHANDFRHEEVASHIYRFGIWVRGAASCLAQPTYHLAMETKERRIRRYLHAIEAAAPSLSPPRLHRHVAEVALQLERWATLRAEQPLPSTPNVRSAWDGRNVDERAELLATFGRVGRSMHELLIASSG